MKSIREFREKFKGFMRSFESSELLLIIIIILVASASFALGRLSSGPERPNSPISVEEVSMSSLPTEAMEALGIEESDDVSPESVVVASVNGGKYHYTWCSGADRIKKENKIYFLSIEEARSRGYEPALNCKGLK